MKQCDKFLKTYNRIFSLIFIILSISESSAQTILLIPDSSIKGAALGTDRIYKYAAKEVSDELKNNGYNVIQNIDIPRQFLPRKKRPSTADWKEVFRTNKVQANILMTMTITRHIERSPFNQAQIGITAQLFEKRNRVSPLVILVDAPPDRLWTINPQCYGPCLKSFYANKVKEPAAMLAKKLIRLLDQK